MFETTIDDFVVTNVTYILFRDSKGFYTVKTEALGLTFIQCDSSLETAFERLNKSVVDYLNNLRKE